MERILRCGTLLCRHQVTGSQLHGAVLPVSLEHTCYAEELGEKRGGKKSKLRFRPLLSQWRSSGPQLWCKLRFHMNAVACFHCSLGAIYLSYPIYTMHSGLEHKYTSSYNYVSFFLLSPISHTGSDPLNSEEVILISVIFLLSPKAPLISVLRSPNHISRVFHWIWFYPLIWRV